MLIDNRNKIISADMPDKHIIGQISLQRFGEQFNDQISVFKSVYIIECLEMTDIKIRRSIRFPR